ncbi:acyltransferase family protein [uncultured Kordia sp.]|uniref:acyltransferase family protein n=1 Tax=uncultured Kordia sp. TaxID=507699 RepID=UPI00261346DF|nr:acyltransferase family protein [uncultured Kordia sp.]
MKKTARIHSLDSLRAIMMILGLVLHSALTYNVTNHGNVWNIKDPESTHIATDFLVLLIHSFRMPIFFLIAGFFGAMLFYERTPLKMIKNRVQRIVFPFIVFLCLLAPILSFSFNYSNFILSETPNAFAKALAPFSQFYFYIPKITSHLWFLYYLIYLTGFTVIIALVLKKFPKVTSTIKKLFNWVFQRPLIRVLFFAGITFVILSILKTPMIASSVSLLPETNTFVYFVFFYVAGWILYTVKLQLPTLMQHDWFCTIFGFLLVIIQGFIIQFSNLGLTPTSNSPLLITFSALTVWFLIFGITGLFIRYGSQYSKRMRYISDASYWVYLIHLPLTALFPIIVWKLPIGTFLKFTLVVLLTTIVCFITYHYCVRNTFIGQFLNGRKYPRK